MNDAHLRLRELILAIDESDDICVTSWEADFIETANYCWRGNWTPKQQRMAMQIIEKYQDKL